MTYRKRAVTALGLVSYLVLALLASVSSHAKEGSVLTIRIAEQQHVLSLSELEQLPQQQAHFKAAWGPEGLWQGVYLHDLLVRFNLEQYQDIRLSALNDYRIRLTPQEITNGNPILASHFDGEPIPLERNGPFILIWPDQSQQVLDGTAPLALWIWSLTEIRVRP
ncbi:hypothetical protein [Alkalimonas amylolytica]|uniref:Oxidoreductase molybdopterin-binding domain-containing protein n=1 Tax=Alkalimonas amylolytica TaxID=152573 RepID=A0A1H4EIN5_ALKAM|nr:hypothetical protein [Alkalimonas amylolytica]SEA84420.1 hypothetical protein SAMN04488051_10733 [Alkalimonas amylolytica]